MKTVGAALLLVAAVLAVVVIRWIRKRREAASHTLPPLLIPVSSPNHRHAMAVAEAARTPLPERVVPTRPLRPVLADAPPPVDEFDEDPPSATQTIRFRRPSDEPVQLFPGRLEVLAGTTTHREILFVRVPGKPPHLVLGRDPGPAPQYIGLGSPTVSRRHARIWFVDGRWLVKNLSETNPLVVNDEELADINTERPLADGDRLELGEVVLLFHAR